MSAKTNKMSIAVQLTITADHPPFSEVDNAQIRRWAKACFKDDAEVTIRLVGEEEARQLNRDFRGKDYATNVLTFPMEFPGFEKPTDLPAFLADIVVCPAVVEREALDQKKNPIHHLAHLIVHGCLHAQGYLHENEEEAQTMETKEIEILKRFKISNPYKDL